MGITKERIAILYPLHYFVWENHPEELDTKLNSEDFKVV